MASTCSLIRPCARVLVAGGTGTIGSGIVQALLKQGTKVVVGTRCMDKYNALCEATPQNLRGNLSAAVGDLRSEDGAQSVFEQVVGDCMGVQHVIATIKGNRTDWQCGRMWDQSLCEFYEGSREEVTGHFLLMRLFLPYLECINGSTYTILTGYPTSSCPPPGLPSSLVCLASGTVRGLADGARAEHNDSCVAVSEVYLRCTVHRQLDCNVCCLGSEQLGNDLIGSVVTAVAGCGVRREVVINGREDALAWARMQCAPGPYPCPPPPCGPCPPPCGPCPPPPCPPPYRPCPPSCPPPCPPCGPCCPPPCPPPCPRPCPPPCPRPCSPCS